MNDTPEMHEALETIRKAEELVRRERIRLIVRTFAMAAVALLIGRVCKDIPTCMWLSRAIAAVMFGLVIWDIVKLIWGGNK